MKSFKESKDEEISLMPLLDKLKAPRLLIPKLTWELLMKNIKEYK